MVTIGGEKMAKSVGNFLMLRDALAAYDARAIRLAMLQTHYSRAVDLGPTELDGASAAVARLDALVRRAAQANVDPSAASPDPAIVDEFRTAMDDDFNTPRALAAVFDASNRANRAIDGDHHDEAATLVATVTQLASVLGVDVGVTMNTDSAIDALGARTRRSASRTRLRPGRRHPRPARGAGHQARGLAPRYDLAPMNRRGGRPSSRGERPPVRRERRDLGQQVEGRRAVRELLVAGTRQVHDLWLSTDADRAPILDEIAELAATVGAKVRRVPGAQVDQKARTDAPQGVVAFAAPLAPVELDVLLHAPGAFLVALDGVTDPQNLGAVLRSAESLGATGAVLPRHRAVGITPAVTKAAAGAIEHLPIAFVSGIPNALEQVQRAKVWSIGLDAAGETSVFDVAVADQPLVLVLGAEGRGLSRLARSRCDVIASIPVRGQVESLNVSAAAAVACAAIARARIG